MRAALGDAKVDLIVTLGGMGRTQADLEATLGTLAERATWPVVALPGDLEAMTRTRSAAIAELRKRGATVLDGRLVRWIELPGATVGTVPGTGSTRTARRRRRRLRVARRRHREAVHRAHRQAGRPRRWRAPRHRAPMVDGEPTGELALSAPQPVEVVLHGPHGPCPLARARRWPRRQEGRLEPWDSGCDASVA